MPLTKPLLYGHGVWSENPKTAKPALMAARTYSSSRPSACWQRGVWVW